VIASKVALYGHRISRAECLDTTIRNGSRSALIEKLPLFNAAGKSEIS